MPPKHDSLKLRGLCQVILLCASFTAKSDDTDLGRHLVLYGIVFYACIMGVTVLPVFGN